MEDSFEEPSKGFALPGRLEEIRESISLEPRVERDESNWDVDEEGSQKKKRGRKRVTEVVHIINPRVNPPLDFRGRGQDDAMQGASRVFVDDHGSDMHFDWPIYLKHNIRERDAAVIILSNGQSISPDRICCTTPEEYTETGVFIVDVRQLDNLSSLLIDGLGLWGMANTSCTYYSGSAERVSEDDPNWATKVICDRYAHPGTESYGNFNKCIYSGISQSGEACPIAVISYQWEGQPHPITVQDPTKRCGTDVLVETSELWGTCPIFSHSPIDFDAVSRILLGSIHVESDRICDTVPVSFRETGTFLVNIDKAGGEKVLHTAGGGRWSRPSGSSRLFRSEVESGHWMRVDKGRNGEKDEEWDVQIISKRYESEGDPGFMRKIFVIREKRDQMQATHSSLAVITFSWRSEAKGGTEMHAVEGEMERKKRRRLHLDPGMDALSYSELRRSALRKEAQNYERFGALLTRFETIANRYEQIMQADGEERVGEGEMMVVEGEEEVQ